MTDADRHRAAKPDEGLREAELPLTTATSVVVDGKIAASCALW